jgi:hypothetical protein
MKTSPPIRTVPATGRVAEPPSANAATPVSPSDGAPLVRPGPGANVPVFCDSAHAPRRIGASLDKARDALLAQLAARSPVVPPRS